MVREEVIAEVSLPANWKVTTKSRKIQNNDYKFTECCLEPEYFNKIMNIPKIRSQTKNKYKVETKAADAKLALLPRETVLMVKVGQTLHTIARLEILNVETAFVAIYWRPGFETRSTEVNGPPNAEEAPHRRAPVKEEREAEDEPEERQVADQAPLSSEGNASERVIQSRISEETPHRRAPVKEERQAEDEPEVPQVADEGLQIQKTNETPHRKAPKKKKRKSKVPQIADQAPLSTGKNDSERVVQVADKPPYSTDELLTILEKQLVWLSRQKSTDHYVRSSIDFKKKVLEKCIKNYAKGERFTALVEKPLRREREGGAQ